MDDKTNVKDDQVIFKINLGGLGGNHTPSLGCPFHSSFILSFNAI